MNNPKISVLMPVYNAENFLKEAIDSILNQTFKDFEFLIINDGSTDKSKEIILSYNDPRIRYFENKSNLGVARTLNKGLRIAKGKYIARMDADDISYIQRLKLEYDEIIKNQMVAVIASYYDVISEKGKYLYTVKDASSVEEIYYALQFRNCLGHPTVIFNKEIVLNEFHGYKSCEAEDYELWLRVSKKYKILKVKNILHQLRISDISRMSQSKEKIIKNAMKITQNNLQSLIGKPINIDIVSILSDLNPLSYSPIKIKQTLSILEEINTKILEHCPSFLDKSIIEKCSENKINWVKFCHLTATFFSSRLGQIFKALYKLLR